MAKQEKSSGESHYGLLIASVVSIVAIVGLVILFKGGTTGNVVSIQGSPDDWPGIGSAYLRGYNMVKDPINCPTEDGYTGIAYKDFNENVVGCQSPVLFPRPLGTLATRYTGVESEPKGYRAVEGGMYTADEATTTDTFYRGQQGTAYREGKEKSYLVAASGRGDLIG